MTESQFPKGISAEDLRLFLEWWPRFATEGAGIREILIKDKELLFGENSIPFSWCHIYEMPAKEQFTYSLAGFLQDENFVTILKDMVDSPSQIGAIPDTVSKLEVYLDSLEEPSKEDAIELIPFLAPMLAMSFAAYNSLRCVLYHGCYLNELIQRASTEDKALFDAVRIDPTVIGCKPIIARISKATLLNQTQFFAKLKAVLTGKIAKREQANYQKMRLVLEILHEAGATRLSDSQLNELFVEELKLYAGNKMGGGSAKALRKFADTYMKKNSTT